MFINIITFADRADLVIEFAMKVQNIFHLDLSILPIVVE